MFILEINICKDLTLPVTEDLTHVLRDAKPIDAIPMASPAQEPSSCSYITLCIFPTSFAVSKTVQWEWDYLERNLVFPLIRGFGADKFSGTYISCSVSIFSVFLWAYSISFLRYRSKGWGIYCKNACSQLEIIWVSVYNGVRLALL